MKRIAIVIPENNNYLTDIYLHYCIKDCINRGEIPCIFSEYVKNIQWYRCMDLTAFYCDMGFTDDMSSKKNRHLFLFGYGIMMNYDFRCIDKGLWKGFQKLAVSLGFDEPQKIDGVYL